MPNTNASTEFSALGQQAAILGWLQIPVEKRQALHNRIAERQKKKVQPQTAGTTA